MGSMVQAKLTIRGTRTFLYHHFWEGVFDPKVLNSGTPGKNPDEWQNTYLCTSDGTFYLNPTYILTSIKEGGKNRRVGKKNLKVLIGSTLLVTDDVVLTNRKMPVHLTRDSTQDVYLDVRPVVVGKARHLRYRVALSPGWTATCHLMWDRSRLDPNTLESVISDAGAFEGIGDGRSIGMGRYVIDDWTWNHA